MFPSHKSARDTTPDTAVELTHCRHRRFPLNAGGDTELVLLGVGHPDPPRAAETLHVFVEATRAESLQPVDLGLDVVNHDVEVHAVLAGFGFGHALEEKR